MSRFKYQGRLEYLPVLTLLLEVLRDDIPQRPSHVCPLPLHWLRRVRRGFNQSELLARALASTMGVPIVNHWLHKPRSTRPQVGLDEHMRQSNVKGAFAARRQCSGSHVLLVDDVMTTGATLLEARAVLLDAGAKRVDCLVLAATTHNGTQAM
ncbi:MAG: phosphoribosyltransferase family protein [Pseudomonadota bacterium]